MLLGQIKLFRLSTIQLLRLSSDNPLIWLETCQNKSAYPVLPLCYITSSSNLGIWCTTVTSLIPSSSKAGLLAYSFLASARQRTAVIAQLCKISARNTGYKDRRTAAESSQTYYQYWLVLPQLSSQNSLAICVKQRYSVVESVQLILGRAHGRPVSRARVSAASIKQSPYSVKRKPILRATEQIAGNENDCVI